jgi:hypothetical protein
MIAVVVGIALAIAWTHAGAKPSGSSMDETAIRAAFAGKTIQGNYASGKPFTETYEADGAIIYRERNIEYRGHWSIQGDAFCTIYNSDPTGGCFTVKQESTNCYEFYFVSRTEGQAANNETVKPAWTARAAVTDRDATCADRQAV